MLNTTWRERVESYNRMRVSSQVEATAVLQNSFHFIVFYLLYFSNGAVIFFLPIDKRELYYLFAKSTDFFIVDENVEGLNE